MSEEVGVKIDLDLDTKKAKNKLDNFRDSAIKQDIKIKLDFKNITSEANKLHKTINNAFKLDNKSLNSLNDVEKRLKNINKLLSAQKNVSVGGGSVNNKGLDSQVSKYLAIGKKLESLYSDLYKSESKGTNSISQKIQREIELHKQKQAAIAVSLRANNQLNDSTKELIRREEELHKARTNTRNATTDNSINVRNTREEQVELTRLTSSYDKYQQKLENIQDKLTSMKNSKGFLDNDLVERTNNLLEQTRNSLDADGIESDFEQVDNTVRELTRNLNDINIGNTLSRQEANFNTSLENMRNRVERFADSFREVNGADAIVDRLRNSLNDIDTSNIERATVELREFGTELNRAGVEVRELDRVGRSGFFSNFGDDFRSNMFAFTAGELLADGIRNVGYALKTLVMEYDKAFTNLKKVADPADIMSIEQLDAIEEKAVSIAKNVGQSSIDVIQAIADTTQATGLGMEQATMVAEQTMMLANVADMTQEAASKGVNTMLSAFKLDPLKEVSVVIDGVTKSTDELTNAMDKINYVGNNFAVSSEGILSAIQSGANVLAEYGVSMTDTVAMIAAGNTTLQNPEKVG